MSNKKNNYKKNNYQNRDRNRKPTFEDLIANWKADSTQKLKDLSKRELEKINHFRDKKKKRKVENLDE